MRQIFSRCKNVDTKREEAPYLNDMIRCERYREHRRTKYCSEDVRVSMKLRALMSEDYQSADPLA